MNQKVLHYISDIKYQLSKDALNLKKENKKPQ